MRKYFNGVKVGVGAAAMAVGSAAMATGLDVSALETKITDTLTPIGTIGIAVLGVFVGVKVFKWIKGAL